uniref:RNA polymerase sigma factor n=1 Tax=Streptomyces sp. NBC_01001 TaxID=2903713 RepID=UPI002F914F50
MEGRVGQQLLDIYPEYSKRAPLSLTRRWPGMPLAQAEDFAAEAFYNTAMAWLDGRVNPRPDRLMAYLIGAARNLAVDGFRKERLVPVSNELLASLQGERAAQGEDSREALFALLDGMKRTRRRQVMELEGSGLSDQEIAEELGITLNSVWVHRHNAMAELRSNLGGHRHPERQKKQYCGEKGSGE